MKNQLDQLASAVEAEAKNKLLGFYEGLAQYAAQQITEWEPEAEVIWHEGSTRILDYGGNGEPVLFISPLINKASILDLSNGRSLMKFLRLRGLRPLLVDWGIPGEEERDFGSEEYTSRLARFATSLEDGLIIGGYCMGGLMALKLAQKIPPRAMILLATPWNFHSPDVKRTDIPKPVLAAMLDQFEYVPPEIIQSLFLLADPWRVYDKYSRYRTEYNEIEHWVNNGVPMTLPLAREAIISWAHENKVGKGEWVDVANITAPVFLGCPTADRIVPIGCSIPLAGLIVESEVHKFRCGHVGLVSHPDMREKLSNWLKSLA